MPDKSNFVQGYEGAKQMENEGYPQDSIFLLACSLFFEDYNAVAFKQNERQEKMLGMFTYLREQEFNNY